MKEELDFTPQEIALATLAVHFMPRHEIPPEWDDRPAEVLAINLHRTRQPQASDKLSRLEVLAEDAVARAHTLLLAARNRGSFDDRAGRKKAMQIEKEAAMDHGYHVAAPLAAKYPNHIVPIDEALMVMAPGSSVDAAARRRLWDEIRQPNVDGETIKLDLIVMYALQFRRRVEKYKATLRQQRHRSRKEQQMETAAKGRKKSEKR